MRKLLGLGRLLWLLFAISLASCSSQHSNPLVGPGMYKNTEQDLARLWKEILLACQKDDRGRAQELMRSFVMTDAELGSLLGVAQAQALGPRYRALLASMVTVGAVELVAYVYDKKPDDIAISRVDTSDLAALSESDRKVVQALSAAGTLRPIYTVRVKKKTEKGGLRYDFFVYLNGFWRSGNLLGKFL